MRASDIWLMSLEGGLPIQAGLQLLVLGAWEQRSKRSRGNAIRTCGGPALTLPAYGRVVISLHSLFPESLPSSCETLNRFTKVPARRATRKKTIVALEIMVGVSFAKVDGARQRVPCFYVGLLMRGGGE